MSSVIESFWRGGGFVGDDRSGEFVDLSRPAVRIKVMGVESVAQAELVRNEYTNEILQFWTACNAQHHLGTGDHRSYRKRVRDIQLVYVTQAGQPYIEVWPDQVVETSVREQIEALKEAPPKIPPIYIERPRKGTVTQYACYEAPVNRNNFADYPPALWFTRVPPISPIQAGDPADMQANVAEIENVYANLTPADADRYKLSRIIYAEWTDQNDNPRAGYVVLVEVEQSTTKAWEARPPIEFPAMDLLPIEGEPLPPWFPDDYDGPWALPTSPEEVQEELENTPVSYNLWPNGTSATLHDYFEPGAPLFQTSVVGSDGVERFWDLGLGGVSNPDPQGIPDVQLGTCGFRYENRPLQDLWGHPLEDHQKGIQWRKYWPFAPKTFWTPFGQEIVGPHPEESDGDVAQEPPYEFADISPDFVFWLNQL